MSNKRETFKELSDRLEREKMEYIEKDAIKISDLFGKTCESPQDGDTLRQMIVSDLKKNGVALVSFLGVDRCDHLFIHNAFFMLLFKDISRKQFEDNVVIIGMSDDMHNDMKRNIRAAMFMAGLSEDIPVVDVGKEFSAELISRSDTAPSMINRPEQSAVYFRKKYLSHLMDPEFWEDPKPYITLDFTNVELLSATFANEAFAYFTQYAKPTYIADVIKFKGLSRVKESIIRVELEYGYLYGKQEKQEQGENNE